ncbi:hypothetical protein AJ80_03578 [Polytolypa hystricis UAMH7299]|uniref:Dynamin N-terminal domain-containing protein n=1 Tax=Polytolypa hystricis (strain UAMH7299) TaxID=1447883 RepID=A0A2B7YHT8_POLH7|nr:hypothetical protein AJ80_03578 [Polytolypa hystricis UAMH7299]
MVLGEEDLVSPRRALSTLIARGLSLDVQETDSPPPVASSPCRTLSAIGVSPTKRYSVKSEANGDFPMDTIPEEPVSVSLLSATEPMDLDPVKSEEPEACTSHLGEFSELLASGKTGTDRGDQITSATRYVAGDSSLDNLRAGVVEGVDMLTSLSKIVHKYSHGQSGGEWAKEIEDLKEKANIPRVIIGVVGTTGAGKSSLINALLDEERLVPTSSMRACTAVVTEISFNNGPGKYRAEIEFISSVEWEKELQLLFQELGDENEDNQFDSDSTVALAEIKAVYSMSEEEIRSASVQELLGHRNVSHLLGTTRHFHDENPITFYRNLQVYIDSKEKGRRNTKTETSTKVEPGLITSVLGIPGTTKMEFWPLIKVVRLYIKAPVLSTGAVLVDLPGLQDSNAARAAVAAKYIEQCSCLWVVAPITRAVDDRTAITLLGDSFKRQMQMDGGICNVSFICSKTDDISLTETHDSLGLAETREQLCRESDEVKNRISLLESTITQFKAEKEQLQGRIDVVCDELEEINDLQDSLLNAEPLSKRRRSSSLSPPTRQSPALTESPGKELTNEVDSCSSEPSSEPSSEMTRDVLGDKFRKASQARKMLQSQKRDIGHEIVIMEAKLAEAQEEEKRMHEEFGLNCILGRNQYAKSQIRRDYAAGIRQLDQCEIDDEGFEPTVIARDYNEIARSLPVFCISSRGYQKLKGRFRRDLPVKGFRHSDETEIPLLQKHCMESTVVQLKMSCNQFLNGLQKLLNSLALRSSDKGAIEAICEERKLEDRKFLRSRLNALDQDLRKLHLDLFSELNDTARDNIFDRFDFAAQHACRVAAGTVSRWNRPRTDADTGLAWNTYRAICRRGGVYHNSAGSHVRKYIHGVLVFLVETFTVAVPRLFAAFADNARGKVVGFQSEVEEQMSTTTGISAISEKLKSQAYIYSLSFKDLSSSTETVLSQYQKARSREFVPSIERTLATAYEECAEKSGKGVLRSMKDTILESVENARHSMFLKSTKEVEGSLKKDIASVKGMMTKEIGKTFKNISRDYKSAFEQSHSAEERALNAELEAFLKTVTMFDESSAK